VEPHDIDFQVGGTLMPKSVYVTRTEDEQFLNAASGALPWINIHGCRTMGKSSLYARHLATLAERGVTSVVIDVASQVGQAPKTAAEWFCALAEVCISELNLSYAALDNVIGSLRMRSAGTVAVRLLSEAFPTSHDGRILFILDEYDYIANLSYSDDILFALRHIQSRQAVAKQLTQFSFCFVGWQPLHSFGAPGAANTSPICTPIEMRDFERVSQTLQAIRRGFPTEARPPDSVLTRVLELSGGQPLVTMELLAEIRRQLCNTPAEVNILAHRLVAPSGLGADLQLFTAIEKAIAGPNGGTIAALSAYKSLLEGSVEAHTAPGVDLLLLFGILRRRGDSLEVKGEIFSRRFDIAWADRMFTRLAASPRLQQYRGGTRTSDKRICVINAGGTLGMVQRGEHVVAPRDEQEFKAYFTSLDSIAEHVEFINLFPPRDSINVFPDQWVTIARYIHKRRLDGFDGFVVAHGTDTMAYTASAVAFALGSQLRFPVVFTGAQTTPDVAFGDAHVNLYRACEVAKKQIPEVVISFGNFVYRAVRAQKRDDRRFDGFESATYPPLAEITGEVNVRTELLRELPNEVSDIELRANFERSILIVPQFPGLEPGFFSHLLTDNEGRQRCNGVIVQTLGAGNVTSEPPYSFIPFVERAYRRGIPVIVTSQYPPDPGTHTKYTPAQAPIEAGAIHAGNMTLAAAVTKFRWVLAQLRRKRGWKSMAPAARRNLVSEMMVEQSLIGEF
jgi:L-asparaginase